MLAAASAPPAPALPFYGFKITKGAGNKNKAIL
jgi:hypothetical protein